MLSNSNACVKWFDQELKLMKLQLEKLDLLYKALNAKR